MAGFQSYLVEQAGPKIGSANLDQALAGFGQGVKELPKMQNFNMNKEFLDQMANEAELPDEMRRVFAMYANSPEQMHSAAAQIANYGSKKRVERKGLEYLSGVGSQVKDAVSKARENALSKAEGMTAEEAQKFIATAEKNAYDNFMNDVRDEARMSLDQETLDFVGPRLGIGSGSGKDSWLDYQMKQLEFSKQKHADNYAIQKDRELRLAEKYGRDYKEKAMKFAERVTDPEKRTALLQAKNTADKLRLISKKNSDLAFAPMSNSFFGDKTKWLAGAARGVTNEKFEEWRSAKQELDTVIGDFMANYIKSKSGLAVTDTERRFLKDILALGNNATYGDFISSFNLLLEGMKTDYNSGVRLSKEYAEGIEADISPFLRELEDVGNIVPLEAPEGSRSNSSGGRNAVLDDYSGEVSRAIGNAQVWDADLLAQTKSMVDSLLGKGGKKEEKGPFTQTMSFEEALRGGQQ